MELFRLQSLDKKAHTTPRRYKKAAPVENVVVFDGVFRNYINMFIFKSCKTALKTEITPNRYKIGFLVRFKRKIRAF